MAVALRTVLPCHLLTQEPKHRGTASRQMYSYSLTVFFLRTWWVSCSAGRPCKTNTKAHGTLCRLRAMIPHLVAASARVPLMMQI
jgi:hypothetical protein